MIEKNHEMIRYVIPKGKSLDGYTQADTTQLMIDNRLHEKLGLKEIMPDDITPKPSLLKH